MTTHFPFRDIYQIRQYVSWGWCNETVSGPDGDAMDSYGQCAVTALWVLERYGGSLVSARVNGVSHWYNYTENLYVDLTGDQFGYPEIQISNDPIYPNSKFRSFDEIDGATWNRYQILLDKLK